MVTVVEVVGVVVAEVLRVVVEAVVVEAVEIFLQSYTHTHAHRCAQHTYCMDTITL